MKYILLILGITVLTLQIIYFIYVPKIETKIETISLIKEIEECKKVGGVIDTDLGISYVISSSKDRYINYSDRYIRCIKNYIDGNKIISETIFNYKLKI